MDEDEFFDFLKKRRGLLDGVCISGGEPLLQNDICDFAARIRALGYKIKLDTNGTFPNRLRALIENGLADYVAMDLKNAPSDYGATVGTFGFDFAPVARSMEILRTSGVPYEYRTTVVKPLHTMQNLEAAAELLLPGEAWFLQQYTDSGDILGTGLCAFTPEEMRLLATALRQKAPGVRLRGL